MMFLYLIYIVRKLDVMSGVLRIIHTLILHTFLVFVFFDWTFCADRFLPVIDAALN